MLILQLELNPAEPREEVSVYSLGDMTLRGRYGTITSKGKQPDQSMMIFLSILQLLYQVQLFAEDARSTSEELYAIDSSFSFTMRRKPGAFVALSSKSEEIDILPIGEFIQSIWTSVEDFVAENTPYMTKGDPVFDDFTRTMETFKATFKRP